VIGIVLVGHSEIAPAMRCGIEHVLGPQPQLATLAVAGSMRAEAIEAELRVQLATVEEGSGALIMADMLGGTPCNVAASLCSPGRIELVCGLNLPMAIKAVKLRSVMDDPALLAATVVEAGRSYIRHLEPQSHD